MSQPSRLAPASFLKHAGEVAASYGFKPLREVEKSLAPELKKGSKGVSNFLSASTIAVQAASTKGSEPVLTYWASSNPSHLHAAVDQELERQAVVGGVGEFTLQIVGVSEATAEAVLLKAIATILADWGAPVLRVRLNALGDRDSKVRFEREVAAYVRKHAQQLGEECRNKITHEPLAPYFCETELCRGVVESGPRPMSFLSEKSRAHFKEVLEHLDKVSLPYEFDDLLLGDEREQRVMVSFDLEHQDPTIIGAWGGRYDDFLRRLNPRKEQGGVAASIYFRKKGLTPSHFNFQISSRSPSVYFIQLGVRAKLEGLLVADALRRARVPVLQSFDSSRLSHQLSQAREAGVSHLIIMGEREALDRTVLIRATDDNSQHIVPLLELPRFLKNLK